MEPTSDPFSISPEAVVCLSGGMDSVTLLAKALTPPYNRRVRCVGFTYGSKHNLHENMAAAAVCGFYGVPFHLMDLSPIMCNFRSALLKTGGPIPEGHYEAANMTQTVVPGRNLIFLSVLTGYAWSVGAQEVWIGIHSGDHAIYPDCRPEFFEAMDRAMQTGSDGKVKLVAPFLKMNKTSIIAWGRTVHVPYYLTRTCYKDQTTACGKCGACQERLEAFAANGMSDPIEYESREIVQPTTKGLM